MFAVLLLRLLTNTLWFGYYLLCFVVFVDAADGC